MKFIDKLRDILYDSMDYIFMLVIIVAVVAVIGWRLDILFAKDSVATHDDNSVIVVEGKDKEEPNQPNDTQTPIEPEKPEDPSDTEEPTNNDDTNNTTPVPEPPPQTEQPQPTTGEKVKIVIPEGSLPGKIGLILEENGLITSARDFIAKAVELRLDTKLRSGTFEIQKGKTVEEIVKIIAKQAR